MRKAGDDAIECSGVCAGWIHRRCAGLNKKAYSSLSDSNDPFFCPHCRMNKQELELESLRNLVSSLSAHLSLVSDELSSLKKAMSKSSDDVHPSLASVASTAGFNPPQPCTQKTFAQAAQAAQSSSSERSKGSPQQSERDQNVILFGVEEYAAGTTRLDRLNRDMDRATSVLSKLVSHINHKLKIAIAWGSTAKLRSLGPY